MKPYEIKVSWKVKDPSIREGAWNIVPIITAKSTPYAIPRTVRRPIWLQYIALGWLTPTRQLTDWMDRNNIKFTFNHPNTTGNMTLEQAKKALEQGKTIAHDTFAPNEWIRQVASNKLIDESKVLLDYHLFFQLRQSEAFQHGWRIVYLNKPQ